MKKLISLILVVVCIGGFSLGCGKKTEEAPKPDTSATADDGTVEKEDDDSSDGPGSLNLFE